VGRPEEDPVLDLAMNQLGNGLSSANHHEEALSVGEAELSIKRRLGVPESSILVVQGNLAMTHHRLGRNEEALRMRRDVYSGYLTLNGEDYEQTLMAAVNYAGSLIDLERFEEAKALMCKAIPVARRVLGESDETTLAMRQVYAVLLYENPDATLDDLCESVTTLEESTRIARRVFGGAHPITVAMEKSLQNARAKLRARDRGDVDVESIREAVGAMTAGDG